MFRISCVEPATPSNPVGPVPSRSSPFLVSPVLKPKARVGASAVSPASAGRFRVRTWTILVQLLEDVALQGLAKLILANPTRRSKLLELALRPTILASERDVRRHASNATRHRTRRHTGSTAGSVACEGGYAARGTARRAPVGGRRAVRITTDRQLPVRVEEPGALVVIALLSFAVLAAAVVLGDSA